MRSPKLTSALLAAAALLVLATAGTAAARVNVKHNSATGRACRITLSVAERRISAGESVLASGQTLCAPAEGQKVIVYQRAVGAPGYSVAGEATSGKNGFYEVKIGPLNGNTVFYAATGASRSLQRQVKVAPIVTLEEPSEITTIETGKPNAVKFSGKVKPEKGGLLVVLQRENAVHGSEWHRIAATTTDNAGNWSLTHTFVVPGASSLRIVVRSSHHLVNGFSEVRSYEISQAENPSLTIQSATNPVTFGGTTVIEGTVPSVPAGTQLTLQGHPAHGQFATVTTTTTEADGHYAFPTQTPLTSMFYRVTGAGRTSSVLYEGVKYQLAAAPLATTVSSGQPVEFTGTVAPVSASHGQAVYLEKRNAYGTGFHAVEQGTVNPNGTFTIAHAFFAPGEYEVRVKVPGNPENGGTATTPVKITVTPLPGQKVPAESPHNGTQPPEGEV